MVALSKVIGKNSGQPMKAQDVARFYLGKASGDGDLISHLKMQKLVYYAYVWTLVNTEGQKLFDQPIEAWPNGPVVVDLYHDLKVYGSMPINEEYVGDAEQLNDVVKDSGFMDILNEVYETYMPKTAFELVTLTHSEKPWLEARGDKKPTDTNSTPIKDETILAFYAR